MDLSAAAPAADSPDPHLPFVVPSHHTSIVPRAVIALGHALGVKLADCEPLDGETDPEADTEAAGPLVVDLSVRATAATKRLLVASFSTVVRALRAALALAQERQQSTADDLDWPGPLADAWKVFAAAVTALACEGTAALTRTRELEAQLLLLRRSWAAATGSDVGFDNRPGQHPDLDLQLDLRPQAASVPSASPTSSCHS
jgi:hypothetical protein